MKYWQKQTSDNPLFKDILWAKPERRQQLGTIGLIGGHKNSFLAVSHAYQTIMQLGSNSILVLPKELQKILQDIPQAIFSDSNHAGGLSQKALPDLIALKNTTDVLLLIGDASKNHETALVYEKLLLTPINKPVIAVRDAIDIIIRILPSIINNPNLILILSLSQLQKTLQTLYYPIVITHSIQMTKLIEALHKFTITYPITLCIYHQNQLLIAQNGRVISCPFMNLNEIWQGILPARIACWVAWNPHKKIEAIATALYDSNN